MTDFLPEKNGDFWIARQTGLCRYDQLAKRFIDYPLVQKSTNSKIDHGNNNFITCMLKDLEGRLWLSTYGGINLYHPQTDSFIFYPLKHPVNVLFHDQKGTLWVGTTADGFFIFDHASKSLKELNFFPKEILTSPHGNIDQHGRFWLLNRNKLYYYDPESEAIRVLDEDDGLISN